MDHKKFRHTTTHGLRITTTLGNITKVTADAVVTGDGCDLDRESGVTVALQNAIPKVRDVRRRLRKEYGELDLWTVKSSPLGFHFKYIIFAILTKGSGDAWVKRMKTLYKKIFEEADRLKICAIALPLLGAGTADTERSLSIQAFVTSALQCSPNYLTDIMIVNNNSKVLDMIHAQIMFEESGISEPSEGIFPALWSGLKNIKDRLSPFSEGKQQQTARYNCSKTHQPWHGGDQRNLQDRASQAASHNPCQQNNDNEKKSRRANNKTSYSRGREQTRQPTQCNYACWEDDRQLQMAIEKSKREDDTKRKHSPSQQAKREEQRQVKMAMQLSKQEANNTSHLQQYSQGESSHPQYFNHPRSSVEEDSELQEALQRSRDEAAAKDKASVSGEPRVRNGSTDSESDFGVIEEETSEGEIVKQDSLDKNPTCIICLNDITVAKKLEKCGHIFCEDCIDRSFRDFKPVCPSCNMVYGEIRGNQPDGSMDVCKSNMFLPGHDCGTINITYTFPSGKQKEGHPNPGRPYKGTTRKAYLPDSTEGNEILNLLQIAFDRKLTFTIGRSTTTGRDDVVTWNDIHHKTNMDGGPTRFGYPDPTYLSRVRDELASKGVS